MCNAHLTMNCRFTLCVITIAAAWFGGMDAAGELLNEVPPAGVLIEAELCPANGRVQVLDEPNASGGKIVTTTGSWQPLFIGAVPDEGDQLTLWIRHKGGAICLKTVIGGEMSKDKWIWSRPEKWAWTNVGRYDRKQLGERIHLLRNDAKAPDAFLDCVVFSADADAKPTGAVTIYPKELPTIEPDNDAPPIEVLASVDWGRIIGKMSPMIWGIEDYEIMTPDRAADPGFNAYLASVRPAFMRIHCGYQQRLWGDEKTGRWDAGKIKAGFDGATGYGDATIMMCINGWPETLAEVPAPREKEAAIADYCVELVRIMRDTVKRKIAYWEFFNEMEASYEPAGRMDDYFHLINTVAAAIKKEDPSAKVGGCAFAWNKPAWVEGYLKHCAENVDFLSWHNYAVGDAYDSNEYVFARLNALEKHARDTMIQLDMYVPNRKLETFLTEHNVNWTWNASDRRMAAGIGAVFEACFLKRMARVGLTATSIHHTKQVFYGLIGMDNEIHPTGYLYRWSQKFLTGDVAFDRVGDQASVEVLPIVRADGRSLLLMNKTRGPVVVPMGGRLLRPEKGKTLRMMRIGNQGESTLPPPQGAEDLILPGWSVTLITTLND